MAGVSADTEVKDAAVVGLPHDPWGEAVHAVVVRQHGTEAASAEALHRWRGRIARGQRPQALGAARDADRPRTAAGKIPHRALHKRLADP